jgi:hypothetical protein
VMGHHLATLGSRTGGPASKPLRRLSAGADGFRSGYVACLALAACCISAFREMLDGSRDSYPSWAAIAFCGLVVCSIVASREIFGLVGSMVKSTAGLCALLLLCYVALHGLAAAAEGNPYFFQSHLVSGILPMFVLGCLVMPGAHEISGDVGRSPRASTLASAAMPALVAVAILFMGWSRSHEGRWAVIAGIPMYQTVGDLYLCLFVGSTSLAISDAAFMPARDRWKLATVVLVSASLGAAALQLVGSNKGCLGIVACGTIVTSDLLRMQAGRPAIGLLAISARIAIMLAAMFWAVDLLGIATSANDFGAATALYEISSVASRLVQLESFASGTGPEISLFGSLNPTEYVHSAAVSALIDLGIFGFALMSTAFTIACAEAGRRRGAVVRSAAVPIVGTAVVSSYFTWGPLWFLLGLLLATRLDSKCSRRASWPAGHRR